jgi:hypothetical protein
MGLQAILGNEKPRLRPLDSSSRPQPSAAERRDLLSPARSLPQPHRPNVFRHSEVEGATLLQISVRKRAERATRRVLFFIRFFNGH